LVELGDSLVHVLLGWLLDLCDNFEALALEFDELAAESEACATLWMEPLWCVRSLCLRAGLW